MSNRYPIARGVALVLMLLVALLALASGAVADSLAIDFESYALGTVNGQDGWSSTGAAGSGCAVYDHAVVNNTYGIAAFGAKSLRISNAVTSGCFDHTFSKSLTNEAGETSAVNNGMSGGTRQKYFEAEWQFASTVPGAEQPGLSVVASPDRGDGARMSWVQMTDTPSGLEVNFFEYDEDADPACSTGGVDGFVFTNLASGLSRAVPHTIKITMEFVDGVDNDIVKVYVDGVLEGTGGSWEDYFRDCEPNPTRPVDSILFRTGGVAAPATAGAGFVIDNFKTFSGPVPCTTICYADVAGGNDANGGTSPADAKETIQAAINTVQPGGEVRVLPGTYPESPTINKSLTLVSTLGRDVTTIDLQTGTNYTHSMLITGAEVTVDGFTVEGIDAACPTLAATNIYLNTAPDDVVIKNNRIQVGQIDGACSTGDDGFGLITEYSASPDVAELTVEDNIFEPLNTAGGRAFYINPSVVDYVFRGNEIDGNFVRTAITQAQDSLIEENTVTGTGSSAGIGVWGEPDPAVWGHATIQDNTISGTANAVSIFEAEDVNVNHNVLNANSRAVRFLTVTPLAFDKSTIHINRNALTANTTYGIDNQLAEAGDIDGICNWWDAADGPGPVGPGSGDNVSAKVAFAPWLTSADLDGSCFTGAIFMSTRTAGQTGDGLDFGAEDVILWNGSEWEMWFDGTLHGLVAQKAQHNINAIWIPDPNVEDFIFSFGQNKRSVPGMSVKVDGMDLVRWDGSVFSLYFDGNDVDLTNKTQEKIDALDIRPGSESPINGGACEAYLLISTQGPGKVKQFGGGQIKFGGEDVLGFCATELGETTNGFWHMVLDGSAQGMPKNSTDSISVSDDGSTMYLTTQKAFNVDSASGGHSMVYTYDFGTTLFSGPIFDAPANGLPATVNALQVSE